MPIDLITVTVITHEHTIGRPTRQLPVRLGQFRSPQLNGHSANAHAHDPAEHRHAKTLLLAEGNVTMPSLYTLRSLMCWGDGMRGT
jgi:hypothetical protein